jgi:hypothetical protein
MPGPWNDRSVPLGKYWCSSPLVFSLVPRCHGLCGSQKPSRDLLGALPHLQPLHDFGPQGRARIEMAVLGTLEVHLGDVLADPGPIPRTGRTLDDLAIDRVAMAFEQFSGLCRGVSAFEQLLKATPFAERQRCAWPPRSGTSTMARAGF